ncbi:hypothetical protein [Xylophilus ampelinus]|uniref:Uncharacterized protein n=1 Tax=Xylophilus ampelinus TaxID=54067 RepID=A0A318SLL6_9BURK|nr:hypothetical protein [Xylophilus ampelinus]MCS4510348.1 hypothetical protein [Xylophilus ampelinus]PYE78028.1 hypothetical protein DFQ15_11056 [Xylophilus ampelinus]
MIHLPTIRIRAAHVAVTTLVFLAAGAAAQGTSGDGSPQGATAPSAHDHPAAVAGGTPHAGAGHDGRPRKAAAPKREGDLGRAPFGTGGRRHDASDAGAPSPKPKGDSGGTAGTR